MCFPPISNPDENINDTSFLPQFFTPKHIIHFPRKTDLRKFRPVRKPTINRGPRISERSVYV